MFLKKYKVTFYKWEMERSRIISIPFWKFATEAYMEYMIFIKYDMPNVKILKIEREKNDK